MEKPKENGQQQASSDNSYGFAWVPPEKNDPETWTVSIAGDVLLLIVYYNFVCLFPGRGSGHLLVEECR